MEQKAKGLIEKAHAASPDTAEKVFAELARGNSEDPATAKEGGYLPRAYRKNPNKIDAAISNHDMQPGEISDSRSSMPGTGTFCGAASRAKTSKKPSGRTASLRTVGVSSGGQIASAPNGSRNEDGRGAQELVMKRK